MAETEARTKVVHYWHCCCCSGCWRNTPPDGAVVVVEVDIDVDTDPVVVAGSLDVDNGPDYDCMHCIVHKANA